MRPTFVLLSLICGSLLATAQRKKNEPDTSSYLSQPNRIEFLYEKSNNEFHLVNGYDDGLLVVKETYNRLEQGYGWEIYKLDTSLQIVWSSLLIVPYGHTFQGWDYSSHEYFLLFSSAQYKPDEYEIVRINAKNSLQERLSISTVFPIELSHFEVIDKTILMAGTTNFKPTVLTFSLEEKKPRVIPGIYNTNSEILEIHMDDDNGVFSVAMIERMINKRLTVNVKSFTADNLMVQNNTINPGDRKSLIDGAPTDFSSGFQYISGAYSNKSSLYSRGLYLAKFVNGRQQFINYYNFADLTNFFGFLNDKRFKRVRERISKRKEKGKKNRYNYRLLIHEIVQQGNEFILIGEAYYPRYSNYQTYSAYNPISIRNVYSYANIIGYKYTHAIVVSFDQNGNILWDHSFAIDDVFRTNLVETVTVNVHSDRIELLYLEKNHIRSKIVQGHDVLEGKSYTPIRLGSEKESFTIKDPEVEGLDIWYDNVLYAYGEQEIQHDTGGKISIRRNIFYINKIQYNPNGYPD
ncbi:MAG: hypothetical protein OEY56_10185 [Cyclobacteriaceae bacterium]|nr:hypothetical protein [Cyclobacteriaceae bacterium]